MSSRNQASHSVRLLLSCIFSFSLSLSLCLRLCYCPLYRVLLLLLACTCCFLCLRALFLVFVRACWKACILSRSHKVSLALYKVSLALYPCRSQHAHTPSLNHMLTRLRFFSLSVPQPPPTTHLHIQTCMHTFDTQSIKKT